MPSMTTAEILLDEAAAVHGARFENIGVAINQIRERLPADLEPDSEAEWERIGAVYQFLHQMRSRALCLSGGGIRSAAFSLGVVQALARRGFLSNFHYLSTVSGGGYTGSWLSAWMQREGVRTVLRALAEPRNETPDREPAPIHALRDDSSYLTPKVGLMSADTWTGVALYIRNLTMNWAVIGSFVAAIVLIPHVILTLGAAIAGYSWLPAAGAILLIGAGWFTTANRPTWERQRGDQGKFLRCSLAPFLVASLLWVFALTGGLYSPTAWPALWPTTEGNWQVAWDLATIGAALFAVAWLAGARPWKPPPSAEPRIVMWRDGLASAIAGAMFGFVLGWGDALYAWLHDQSFPECVAVFGLILGPLWIVQAQLTAETFFVGLRSAARRGTEDREWLARSAGWYWVTAAAWALFSALVLLGPMAIREISHWIAYKYLVSVGGISGLVTLVLSKSPLTSFKSTAQKIPLSVTLAIAASIFAITLVIGLSALTGLILHGPLAALFAKPWLLPLLVCVVLALLGWILSYFVNINRFSLHSVYRDRLIRAFLGASRTRNPNPFTGFDPQDNLPMADLWPEAAAERPPFHVLNLTLNVVSTRNLAWQQRKAEPFIVGPLHSGSDRVGYRRTRAYANDLSLGTAMAISGAAASPNMGYHSSPPLTFLMALFNVRLGWWLGNPGPEGERTFERDGPRQGAWWLTQEMLGLTTDDRSYVYLSDGGHFENLGIYEMVRRRCSFIVAVDAGCDPHFAFEDLGNAVRKIRIDLGVEISFPTLTTLKPRGQATPGDPYWARGIVSYPEIDPATGVKYQGHILYLKAGYHGDESADIRSYASSCATFPHESTADQWFSESQFESYRALGDLIMSAAIAAPRGDPEPLSDIEVVIRTVPSSRY